MDSGKQHGAQSGHPELHPPGASPDPAVSATTGNSRVWLALIIIAGLGLAVIFVLPQLVSEPPAAIPAATTTTPVSPAIPPADRAAARHSAEQALQSYLQLRARLELAHAAAWGEPEWGRAARAVKNGDRLFGQRQFVRADEAYSAALQSLQTLESGRAQRLATALDSGQQALERDDSVAAVKNFKRVLAIEPGHALATTGLQRAQLRPQLLQLMVTGKQAESANNLAAAQAAYRDAARLDAAYAPAAAALQRVTEQLTDSAYRDAMGRALTALDTGQLQAAGTALNEAATLKPDAVAVRDAQQQLVQARRAARLASLRRQASAKTRREDWTAALALYRKALAVDARAGFARDGLSHAEDRERLHRQLDHYLSDPARIYSAEPLANAEQLLASAGRAPTAEPQLAGKLARLQQLVSAARTLQPVTLNSDDLTDVVIYHVGRLGRFTRRQVDLRPGTYTAVGSRAGYRDVRRTFTVAPGRDQPPVDVRCEEPV